MHRDLTAWPSRDRRRLLRAAIHVSSLRDATSYYSDVLGLTLVAPLDVPGAPIQRALLATSLDPGCFGLELLDGGSALAALVGRWSGHFVLSTPRREECLAKLRAMGAERLIVSEQSAVIPIRNPSPIGTRTLQVRSSAAYRRMVVVVTVGQCFSPLHARHLRMGCFWCVITQADPVPREDSMQLALTSYNRTS